jgi:hypothetical protein
MYTGEVAPAAGAPDVTAALAAYIGPGVDPSVLQDPEVQAAISKAAVAASKDPEEVNSMVSNTLDALNSEATASPTGAYDLDSESEDPLSGSTTADDDDELTDTIEPSGTKTGAKSTTTSDDLLPSSGKKAPASETKSSNEELGAGFKLSAKFGWVSLASMTAAYFLFESA